MTTFDPRGRREALKSAFLGLLAALAILLVLGFPLEILAGAAFAAPVLAGVAALLLVAHETSPGAAAAIARAGPGWGDLLGSVYGILCLGAATLAGAAVGLAQARDPFGFSIGDGLFCFVVKPLYWVGIFGCIPAFALGARFAARVQRGT